MQNTDTNTNNKELPAKTKLALFSALIALIGIVVLTIMSMINVLNPPAELGEMTVTSSGKSINPYTNVTREVVDKKETVYKSVDLKEIADELPEIEYDGDITVNFSDYTLDDFSFSMYDSELNALYTDSPEFVHPTKGGTYIVKTCFSWGYNEKNLINTENYYKVVYTDESLAVHDHK